ncbi:hypothetical protein K456DRAFT_42519 [Colletotrichum gloeosporioides 23]|nr:hypothetical protein K456DRAFT_42519 [Colletotrichum gloeosporioides 23]
MKTQNAATSVVSLGLIIDSGFPWSCKSNSRGASSISSAVVPTNTIVQDPASELCRKRKAGTSWTREPMIYPKYSEKCGQTICRKDASENASERGQNPISPRRYATCCNITHDCTTSALVPLLPLCRNAGLSEVSAA